MRSFEFRAKNIGRERYLTYIMGEGCEMDEDILDLCEENELAELVKIIYHEDDDYDYLTYDVTGMTNIEKFTKGVMNRETVFKLVRNIANTIISCKENAIPLSYILMNRSFSYVDPKSLEVQFICLPVESDASVAAEFKGYIRQIIANMKFDVNEDLSYVGNLLTYINGDSFNLRGLVGLIEALMKDAGIEFKASEQIQVDSGDDSAGVVEGDAVEEESVSSFMDKEEDGPLPEIGDDEDGTEDDEEAVPVDDGEPVSIVPPTAQKTDDVKKEAEPAKKDDASAKDKDEQKADKKDEKTDDKNVEKKEEKKEEKKDDSSEKKTVEEFIDAVISNTDLLRRQMANEELQQMAGLTPLREDVPADQKKAEADKDIEITDAVKPAQKPSQKLQQTDILVEDDFEEEEDEQEESIEAIRARLQRGVVEKAETKPDDKPVRVSRAGLIHNAEQEELAELSEISNSKKGGQVVTESLDEVKDKESAASEALKPAKPAVKVNPYLLRETTGERTVITKAVFKIGKASRGVDYHVGGNGAISRQHALILKKGDDYYLKDNKSTNHTYLGDRMLEEDEEVLLKNNSRIRLGDEDFIFKF